MRTPSFLYAFMCVTSLLNAQNLPGPVQVSDKLVVTFNKNIELLGFGYFIGFETEGIETEVLEMDGYKIPKKEWHAYGYDFYLDNKELRENSSLIQATGLADHLWLDYLYNLLLQIDDFPHARLPDTLPENYYIRFSKSNDPAEARELASAFIDAMNQFYLDAHFDQYLLDAHAFYEAALHEVTTNLEDAQFLVYLEDFYRKSFQQYTLIPTLTTPKGMGFGLMDHHQSVYNVFGAFDLQEFSDAGRLNLGFNNPSQLRELSIHEFGHSFANPAIDSLWSPADLEHTEVLFNPVKEDMSGQNYIQWPACVKEHFVRAVELLIAEKQDPDGALQLQKEYIYKRKFIYLPTLLSELRKYDTTTAYTYPDAVRNSAARLNRLANPEVPGSGFPNDPKKARIHTEDISRFWEVYHQTTPKLKAKVWQSAYIDSGSPGLKGFIPYRIESGRKLAKTIRKNREYYESTRNNAEKLPEVADQMFQSFYLLKQVYPQAVFPDIYFVIGRMNTGGTTFSGGIIIGFEKFGSRGMSMEWMDELVAHEAIHFQQNYVQDKSLLAQCIREGTADFLGEMISGHLLNEEMYAYGNAHKKALWTEFQTRMHDTRWAGWLYGPIKKGRPKDLGYWMGYQICSAYYEQASDKQKAIYDMLHIQDFNAFLAESKLEEYLR